MDAALNASLTLLSEQIANLTQQLAEQATQVSSLSEVSSETVVGVDNFFLVWASVLVLLMQCGFALLETGFVRGKNSINIFLKNLFSPVLAALIWYLWGNGFAVGSAASGNPFIGSTAGNYALSDVHVRSPELPFAVWLYGWTFSSNAATIASGSCAERTLLGAYMIYVGAMVGWIYPVVAYWVFSGGWLSSTGGIDGNCCFISDVGFIDLAGSGVIHLLGGTGALMGSLALGPRLGRFDDKAPKPRGHSLVLSGLGAFLLWAGWYGFNVGSVKLIAAEQGSLSAVVATNTTLAGVTGALACSLAQFALDRVTSIDYAINGLLSGLVAVTSPAGVIEPWAAIVTGIVAGLLLLASDKLVLKLKIDDPLSAISVHMVNGVWGCIVPGLFASKRLVRLLYHRGDGVNYGLFMGGGGEQLGVQAIGILVIMFWGLFWCGLVFFALRLVGYLRVSEIDERMGLDISLHGAHAYNELAVMSKAIAELSQSRRDDAAATGREPA